MLSTDDVLLEDWQGLESELERLFLIYGYPMDDLRDGSDINDFELAEDETGTKSLRTDETGSKLWIVF
jgi:hypothetical protein